MGKPNQSPGGSPEQFSREAVERKVVPMSGPRPQTIARHKVFQERLAAIGRTARAMTRSADRYLEEELGIDVVDDKEDPLSQEEKVQYKKTVEQSVDRMGMSDAPDARRQVMDRIFTPKKFRLLYKKWEKEYGEKVKKNKEFASTVTLEDFVLEKGADYINACRSQIIKGRTGRALDKLSGKDSDPAKEKERVDKIQDDVLQFVKRNEDEMIVFDQLEEGKKKKLRDDFVGIFLENGVDKKDKQKLLALFADIVGDVQYAVNTNVELEATLPEMIAMAGDESITDEMWNDRRQRALQKNAPELAEKPAEYGAQVYMPYGGGTGEGMSVSYESVQDMGGKGNVVLKEAPGKGRGVYELRFPYYTGILKPLYVRIEYKSQPPNINDADIYVQDEFADPTMADGQVVDKKARKYTSAQFREAVNKQILDYQINRGVPFKLPAASKERPNDIITDFDMVHMAEHLFGFKLNSRALEKGHVELYKKFLTVLMRSEAGDDALATRKIKMKNALEVGEKASHIRTILTERQVTTMDALFEEVELRMAGGKKKEKGSA